MLLNATRSQLMIVDMQQRLMPAIDHGEDLMPRVNLLLRGAERLGIPVTVTEQYPKGLGPTVTPVLDALPTASVVLPKVHFSAAGDDAIMERVTMLRGQGRDQIVLCGVEAHVCVLQSALGFRMAGLHTYVVGDAVSSRAPASVAAACARLLHAGCHWITSEMAIFEWLEEAGTDNFRALSALLK
ncbi:isochorismatase family protein [Microvirga puerhi]|uniref:Isochorismatase family protein n=1 Tax=Microvirga puerhi TaxID=2876078 RepID=A0ABS7VLE6_9HYPH|nr:isochorismatase family protein [Microvirga puerhi]MBZ6076363.1 isochorismatase family protein [Microvirga puerhi]